MPGMLEQAAAFLGNIASFGVDDSAIETARDAILDYAGVALAGSLEPAAQHVYAWARERTYGMQATLIGHQQRMDPENAALCNAVAGHVLDFDDTSWTTIGHPTTVVGPAALAVAECVGASGRETLTAYLSGVEVAHRLAEVTMPQVSQNGWHTTSVFYTVGAAAAACALLRLDSDITLNALGLAISRSAGVRANFGSHTKPYHAGMAARNGLEAVSLARKGLTASGMAVEGADGFLRCFGGASIHGNWLPRHVPFGAPFDLVASGLAFKRYPCCSGSHPACDLALDLAQKHDVRPDRIAEIRVGVSLLAERELVCHQPRTPVEARFSMEFALAVALARRAIDLDSFSGAVLADPVVMRLMSVVHMYLDPDLAQLGFIGTAPVKLSIVLDNGQVLEGERGLAVGNPEHPLSTEDRERKFLMCAQRVMPSPDAARAYSSLQDFASAPDVSRVLALLTARR